MLTQNNNGASNKYRGRDCSCPQDPGGEQGNSRSAGMCSEEVLRQSVLPTRFSGLCRAACSRPQEASVLGCSAGPLELRPPAGPDFHVRASLLSYPPRLSQNVSKDPYSLINVQKLLYIRRWLQGRNVVFTFHISHFVENRPTLQSG